MSSVCDKLLTRNADFLVKRLIDLYLDGQIDRDRYTRERQEIDDALASLQVAEVQQPPNETEMRQWVAFIRDRAHTTSLADQRELLLMLLRRVEQRDGTVVRIVPTDDAARYWR